jgi:nucleoid-associated protein YgaU
VTSSKKLLIAGAILATGLALALLFAAPRTSYVAPRAPFSGNLAADFRSPTDSPPVPTEWLAGPAGIDGTRLLPDDAGAEEQTIATTEAPTLKAAAVAAERLAPAARAASPAEGRDGDRVEGRVEGRLVGIRTVSQPTSAANPGAPLAALPQVSVQVPTSKPVYATVEYPEVVSPVANVSGRPVQTDMTQTSFNDSAHESRGPLSTELRPAAADTQSPARRTHIIVDGDSLPKLADRYLGDPSRGQEIFLANQGILTDPDLLPIGVELTIPPRPQRGGTWASSDGGMLDSGLVPVDEIPGPAAPRAQLMKPLPAAWPSP